MIAQCLNTLIRSAFLALGFWLISAIGLVGITTHGAQHTIYTFVILAAGANLAFVLAQPLVKRAAGLPECGCPSNKSMMLKLIGGQFLVACLVVAAAAIVVPSVVALPTWLAVFPAGFLLLVAATLSNIPTRMVDAAFAPTTASKS
jgi:hypothetical protein